MSLLTFKLIEYSSPEKVTTELKLKDETAKRGLREPIRASGLSQHTIKAIQSGRAVRRRTFKSKNYSEFVINFF